MKRLKLLSIVLVVLAVVTVFAGCTSEEPSAGYVDGTYEGSSDAGMHEGLKLSVVVEGGNITAINILEQNETPGVGQSAFDPLTASIIEAQSTEVDGVSGATLTSTAVKEAVDQALAQAQ